MTKVPKESRAERPKAGKRQTDKVSHQNDLLDEGLKETFPASDPVSVARVD